ncbi:MAG TPA: class E sortase [Acidimicrobiia bacterium]|nr:class E sortase [Acidimicrobiia bacterium]
MRRKMVAVALACVSALVVAAPAAQAQDSADSESPSPVVASSSRARADHPVQSVGHLVGRIRIPDIGLDTAVRAGVAIEVIDQGPAHWVGTAQPGETGNVVIAGHRTTHSAPFRQLDQLEPGSLIYLTNPRDFEVMYRVTETFIVEPKDIWITYETSQPMLTMFACHPLGSAAQRIVVRAELLAGRLIA